MIRFSTPQLEKMLRASESDNSPFTAILRKGIESELQERRSGSTHAELLALVDDLQSTVEGIFKKEVANA